MTTPKQTTAALLATAIWADGEYSDIERFMAGEIARSFKIPADEFDRLISAALDDLTSLDEDAATARLRQHASRVHPSERSDIFMAMVQMTLADGILTTGEIHNLFALCEILGIDLPDATLTICELVRADPDLRLSRSDN